MNDAEEDAKYKGLCRGDGACSCYQFGGDLFSFRRRFVCRRFRFSFSFLLAGKRHRLAAAASGDFERSVMGVN